MFNKNPEGYRTLLAYQKASALHRDTVVLVSLFPRTKTMVDLADQMARSGRSGDKNIVEGWKRNTTKEYFDFLGFSIGAIAELKDDCRDVATGLYPELLKVKGVMGEKGIMGAGELEHLRFYPLDLSLSPIVQLYLKAKEVEMLIYKLQQSLDQKMDRELTKSKGERMRENMLRQQKADKEMQKYFEDIGLVRLENGQYISREEWEKRVKGEKGDSAPKNQ